MQHNNDISILFSYYNIECYLKLNGSLPHNTSLYLRAQHLSLIGILDSLCSSIIFLITFSQSWLRWRTQTVKCWLIEDCRRVYSFLKTVSRFQMRERISLIEIAFFNFHEINEFCGKEEAGVKQNKLTVSSNPSSDTQRGYN